MINHKESSVKVYFTRDYNKFKFVKGNRKVTKSKVGRIKKMILDGLDILRYAPINVYEKDGCLWIIDGQNRYTVAKEVGSPVWYIIVPMEMKVEEIAQINSNSENWKDRDYISAYMRNDNIHYTRMNELIQNYGLPRTAAFRLLDTGEFKRDNGLSAVEKVKFKYGKMQSVHYNKALAFAASLKRFEFFPYYTNVKFICALYHSLKVDKLDENKLVKQAAAAGILRVFSTKEYRHQLKELHDKGVFSVNPS